MEKASCGIRLCLTLLNLAVLNRCVLSSHIDFQVKCDTDLLRQFRIECITENGEVSHGRMVSHGTKCLVGCSHTGVSSRGYRVCRNGNWEGNVINCKENTPTVRFESNRNKRSIRRCTRKCSGWWWGKSCYNHCFYLPTIQCPTVPVIQYAARGNTYANVYWNSPTPSGGVGYLWFSQIRGLPSGSKFYGTQYHTILYQVVDAQGNRAFCSFYFQVKVRTCNTPTSPYNGAHSCSRYPVIYGDTCSFTCNIGYNVVGQKILTCGANESFNFPLPRCEAVKCTTPPLRITDGNITCPSNPIYQSLCSIQCNNGFAQSPRGSFSCNQYGRWVGTFRCTDVTPPVFDNCPQNIIVEADRNRTDTQVNWMVKASDNSNDVILEQTEGPDNSSRFTVGTHNISYTATDQSGHSVTCTFTVTVKGFACRPPTFVEDDMDLVSTCESLVVGGSCFMRCKHNKKLEGDSMITCEKDDNMQTYWKYLNLPTCVGEKCPNLTAPRYGALSCSKWNDGAFCSVQCSSRYQIGQGVQNLYICASTGIWGPSDSVPDCVRRRRGSGSSATNELYLNYDGSCEDAKEQIKQNFINKLMEKFEFLCRLEEGCAVENVQVICGGTRRRKRSSHSISKRSANEIVLVWDVIVKFNENKTYEEGIAEAENALKTVVAVIEIDIKNGTYDDLAPGVRTDKESLYTFPTDLVCDYGLKPNYQTNTCASCPTGTIYDKTNDNCQPCPLGTYQDEEASFICKRCPDGTTTQDVASTHQDNCTQICAAGYFSQTGIRPCSPCPLGTFQNQTHSTSCLRCPNGKTSLQEASTDVDSCKEFDFEFEDIGYIESGLTPRTNSSYDESYFSEFTFVALLQIKEQGMDISIQHNGVSYFSIHIGQQITVTISGVSKSVPSILDAWFHIVVTVSSTSTGVKLFSLGQLKTTTHIVSGTSIPGNGTFLHIQSRHGDRVTMRYLRVMSGLLTAGQISSLTNTCGLTDDEILFSLDVFDSLLIRNVSAVSPSTCDVINDCLSLPCGLHL
ncbi:sushi, von Willebrand factor type A, EGF and pentraxin domain-containing protein 1 [Patella vulgata]|uniref:sushi, von Willebrand factor type A, EGF and pentraxin domain-containing protein 1 n=1 Tax=Patella vulgata TaxID=6465 RepID=UPI0024A952AE|nr:sushi, von Willebrand factor type A, EGF and pentraxin domain-containing protein 1 [Patella vulgata]